MNKSQIFYGNTHREQIEQRLKKFLNEQKDFLSARTINSPRAVGDAIENIICKICQRCLHFFIRRFFF